MTGSPSTSPVGAGVPGGVNAAGTSEPEARNAAAVNAFSGVTTVRCAVTDGWSCQGPVKSSV